MRSQGKRTTSIHSTNMNIYCVWHRAGIQQTSWIHDWMIEVLGLYVQGHLWFQDCSNGYQTLESPVTRMAGRRGLDHFIHCRAHDRCLLSVTKLMELAAWGRRMRLGLGFRMPIQWRFTEDSGNGQWWYLHNMCTECQEIVHLKYGNFCYVFHTHTHTLKEHVLSKHLSLDMPEPQCQWQHCPLRAVLRFKKMDAWEALRTAWHIHQAHPKNVGISM